MIKITGRHGDFQEGMKGEYGNKTTIHIHATPKPMEFQFITSNELRKTIDPNYYKSGGIPEAYEDEMDNKETTIERETIPREDEMEDVIKEFKAKMKKDLLKIITFRKTG